MEKYAKNSATHHFVPLEMRLQGCLAWWQRPTAVSRPASDEESGNLPPAEHFCSVGECGDGGSGIRNKLYPKERF